MNMSSERIEGHPQLEALYGHASVLMKSINGALEHGNLAASLLAWSADAHALALQSTLLHTPWDVLSYLVCIHTIMQALGAHQPCMHLCGGLGKYPDGHRQVP